MTSDPSVSIVIPARNAEATLAQALDCLLAQDVADWEAIVVDDSSTDGTAAIAASFAGGDPRFRVLSCRAGCAAGARNLGIAAARGRFLMFLDSDDWVDAGFLAKMSAALETAPDAIAAYCGSCRVMPDGSLTPPEIAKEVALQPFETFARRCAVRIHAVLVDRQTIVELGGFEVTLRTCEDWDLWQRVARLGGRWVEVDEPLAFYRASATSLSRNSVQMLADARIVIGRGFSVDSRVEKAAPAHLNGAVAANGHTAEEALAWFALWNAASDCGSGGCAIDLPTLRALPSGYQSAQQIALVLFDGLVTGSRSAPRQLAGRWGIFGRPVTELIAGLGRAWGDSVASRRVQYHLEQLVLDYDDLSEPRHLALTLGIRVDARHPTPTELPEGIDQIYAYLMLDGRIEAVVQFGALGRITRRNWVELILQRLPSAGRPRGLSAYEWVAFLFWQSARRVASWPASSLPGSAPDKKDRLAAKALLATLGRDSCPANHSERLGRITAEAEQLAGARKQWAESFAPQRRESATGGRGEDRASYWNGFFATEDPWNYGSSYEQEKYERQLQILPKGRIARALELACAEGHFTRQLAPRVEHLIATDVSAVAISRARERCRDRQNVEFEVLDFATDPLPRGMDLIVCSEVLYFLDDLAELRRVAAKLVDALAWGGSLVSAHAFVLRDNMERTAFDWGNKFGAQVIAETLTSTEGLVLERSIQTDLYRIDRFRRLPPENGAATEPNIEHVPINSPIEMEVARHIVRGGARVLRADVARNERRHRMPVLMYHSVAEEGSAALARYRLTPTAFEAQIAWLRANGFHAIMSKQLEWFITNRHPFVGRPVLITFDDGFQNFADNAWPILQAHDMTAEVFLVTDLVGDSARWDADCGQPTPLMDAETIRRLAFEGAFFGSHLATHRAIDGLSTHDLAAELLRSRMFVEQWIGWPISSFAAPYSVTDRRLAQLARECGYRVGFGSGPGPVELDSDPVNLPRIEVRGDRSLEEFVEMMETVLE